MHQYISVALLFLLSFSFTSCNDTYSDNLNHKLTFSVDTLRFDTVFTGIGSETAQIKIYNHHPKAINIAQVGLLKAGNSCFQINVGGMANAENTMHDVEIGAHDSLYLFVEVNIDPTQQDAPLFVNDKVLFSVNDHPQSIELEAYGQDVEILRKKYILNDTTLNGNKPYLVYDYLAIDTAKTLTLDAGCTIYFHHNAQLVVYGNLKAHGTLEKPVRLRGDRLDNVLPDVPYNSVSGQWDGVYLLHKDGAHELHHVELNSGYNGLYLNNEHREKCPTMSLHNVRIHNFAYYGLVVQNADVEVINSEVSNCGSYCVYLSGGTHRFEHTTIANYYNYPATMLHPNLREDKPALCINDIPKLKAPMSSRFRNCIVAGSRTNEIGLYAAFPDKYDGVFEHNLIQADSLTHLPQFKHNKWITNSTQWSPSGQAIRLFKNIRYDSEKDWRYYDFSLDSASVACGIANWAIAEKYPLDKNENNRLADGAPDAGAYERTE